MTPALTYAISDIHGELDLLKKALWWIACDQGSQDARIVFLGDYVDRGPDSRGVLDLLKAGPATTKQEWVILKGNHDHMMLAGTRGRDSDQLDCWLMNGGVQTYEAYFGEAIVDGTKGSFDEAAFNLHLDFIETMVLTFEDEHRIFVHAGLKGALPVDPEVAIWIRPVEMDTFWPDAGYGKLVVHGHTPNGKSVHGKRLNIDGGACFPGGSLTVAKFIGADFKAKHFAKMKVNGEMVA